jgi:hypothetical protein
MKTPRPFKMLIVAVLLAIPLACVGDVASSAVSQDPIEVPMVVEVQSESWCENCNRQPVRNLLERKTVRRAAMKRPAVEAFVQATCERRTRRKPVRSLVRRLFAR